MLPNFLLQEQLVRQDGAGPAIEVGANPPDFLNITLGVTRVLEQESVEVSIWSSSDGENWGDKPIATFPQKFYCGVYTMLVDLTAHTDARYLRAQWKASRWGRGDSTPLFEIYLFAQAAKARVFAAAS